MPFISTLDFADKISGIFIVDFWTTRRCQKLGKVEWTFHMEYKWIPVIKGNHKRDFFCCVSWFYCNCNKPPCVGLCILKVCSSMILEELIYSLAYSSVKKNALTINYFFRLYLLCSFTIKAIVIRSKFFFLFIGREPTTWPANNCLQIMVCSCAMPSNCVWLQIIFCTCVKETVLFSAIALA